MPRAPQICTNCSNEFIPKEANRLKYCSRQCSFDHRKTMAKVKAISTVICIGCNKEVEGPKTLLRCNECKKVHDRMHYHTHKVLASDLYPAEQRSCNHCGNLYQTYKGSIRKYCNIKCGRLATKLNRSHRKRGQYIAPVYRAVIIKRDGCICQLCNKKVDLKKKAPHPMSPTMDHIIPLAVGGTHEPSNVQLAHFLCNSIKGTRGEGQLIMF